MGEGEKESPMSEGNIKWLPPSYSLMGIEPATPDKCPEELNGDLSAWDHAQPTEKGIKVF